MDSVMETQFIEMAIVFGSLTGIVFIITLGVLINSWIKRKSGSGDLSQNKEFLSALREFKEKTDRRLTNLEAIVSEDKPKQSSRKKSLSSTEQNHSIGIEMDDDTSGENPQAESNKLRNMLDQ